MTATQEKQIVELEVEKLELKGKRLKIKLYKLILEMLLGIREFFGRIQGKYKWFEYWWRATILVFVAVVILILVRR